MTTEKRILRREMRAALTALSAAHKRAAGETVAAHLAPFLEVRGALGPVAFFASMAHEIDTRPLDDVLLRLGVGRALPRMVGDALEFRLLDDDEHAHGLEAASMAIPTPSERHRVVELCACSLVVTPGLAFDPRGNRLGHGRGFYDRALAAARVKNPDLVTVGILLDVQRVEAVPLEPHDLALDYTCSPDAGLLRHA